MREIKDINLNFRDLGGLITSDGKRVRNGCLLRCGSLADISMRNLDILSNDYNVKVLIDLRSGNEKKEHPDMIPDGAEYYDIRYFNESLMGITGGRSADIKKVVRSAKNKYDLLEKIPDLSGVYPSLINDEYSCSKIAECIKLIVNTRDGACLFHCTAGKDRTGVTAAIILKILKVPYETIAEDYLKTNILFSKKAKKYSRLANFFFHYQPLNDKVSRAFLADKIYLDSFFNAISDKYGDFDNFLLNGLQLTDDDIKSFREYILI